MLSEPQTTNGLLIVVGGFIAWFVRKTGDTLAAGVKASTEEGAKTAIKNINWPVELRQELEKSRGVERQELRFESYGALWAQLKPLAIYWDEPVNREALEKLFKALSQWYFSASGGMFLLPHARDFYFSLQNFAQTVSKVGEWECPRYDGRHRDIFENVLGRMNLQNAIRVRAFLSQPADLTLWPGEIATLSKLWREDIESLAHRWPELNDQERFATLQQVGSMLRTILANDVESRLR